ncbi:hypothetical protein BH24ACT5_BH24ACT5_15670 [soil metagenome]
MSGEVTSVDAVVIGAGVIGSAVALELTRSGRSVVCLDKGRAPGAGSTSASSSIIRFSYSTLDAVLTAWESAALWRDWSGYLGVDDPDGMVTFHQTGNLIFCTEGYDGTAVMGLWDDIGIAYERLDSDALRSRYPGFDLGKYFPPKRVDDPAFGDDAETELTAFLEPTHSGYIDDPMLAAHNLAHAARTAGCEFRFGATVTAIRQEDGHVVGVTLADATDIDAPVVVNVGGPHSSGINAMAGVTDEMRIGHRPLRQ